MDAVVARLDEMKKAVDGNITGYLDLQDGVQRDKAAVKDLLARGNAAQQVTKDSGNPVCLTLHTSCINKVLNK